MLAGVPVIDHIILGGDQSYYSFREKKVLPMDEIHYSVDLDDVNLKVAEKAAKEYGYAGNKKKSIKESLEEKKRIVTASKSSARKKPVKETMIE